VKPDALGDFTIFSPFLQSLVDNEYANKNVLFIGNEACKDLATVFNFSSNLNFLWLERKKFNRNLLYRFFKELELQKIHCDIVKCPIYQEDEFVTEYIIRGISSKKKVTMRLDPSHFNASRHKQSYTDIILPSERCFFEINAHSKFLFEVNKSALKTAKKPLLKLEKFNAIDLPDPYYVVFIGATEHKRRWSPDNFIRLSNKLQKVYQGTPVFCGAKDDVNRFIESELNHQINGINLIGKTSMSQLVSIISDADFLISNESCAPHIAYISGCNTSYVISNGNHLGRFCPYPDSIYPGYNLLLPPEITEMSSGDIASDDLYYNGSIININSISVTTVFNKIMEAL
jgi:ADP-heptose:LPS heptosyltransferase